MYVCRYVRSGVGRHYVSAESSCVCALHNIYLRRCFDAVVMQRQTMTASILSSPRVVQRILEPHQCTEHRNQSVAMATNRCVIVFIPTR